VLEPLARGGFGAVYLAEQLATERRVALKVLWPHILENARAREQFTLEARVGSRINSENVVQVLDAGVDPLNDITYLVMELLEGRDLARLVRESGPPAPPDALEYLRQTAAGLDKAHRYVDRSGRPAAIIHRDLKPDNLFLTKREDGSPLIKILDFGIAKVLSQSTQMSGDVKGTPLYMAYEQASRGVIGPATDIWAFGLIAFYLFTGRSYWKTANSPEGTMTQLFGEVLSLPLSPPTQRVHEIGLRLALPESFDRWFARCVHRDPAERFQSISEAMRALVDTGVGAERAPAPASLVPSLAGAPPRVDEAAATMASTLHQALTPAALQRTLPASELGPPSAAPSEVTTPRRSIGFVIAGGAVAIAAVAVTLWLGSTPTTEHATSIVPTADQAKPATSDAASKSTASSDSASKHTGSSDTASGNETGAEAPSRANVTPSAARPSASAEKAAPPPRAVAPTAKPVAPKPSPAKSHDDVYGDR